MYGSYRANRQEQDTRDGGQSAAEAFLACNLSFSVAYEMLGSAADAEDVPQETWLQWSGADLDAVRDQRAFPAKITTRQANPVAAHVRPPQGDLRRGPGCPSRR